MEEFIKFFGTPPAVAIAWICTIVSCIYGFRQTNSALKIKQQYQNLKISYSELEVKNITLEQKIIEIEQTQIRDNKQEVTQNGHTNINQGIIKGDFNFNN
ncbi:MAG: hypothetical protein ACRCXK_07495 [Wohlfahrtiimonas sp.]